MDISSVQGLSLVSEVVMLLSAGAKEAFAKQVLILLIAQELHLLVDTKPEMVI